jgi:hypothetical protein
MEHSLADRETLKEISKEVLFAEKKLSEEE